MKSVSYTHLIAIGKVIPSLDGKLSGGAIRVPVSDGSLVDLSLELTEKVTVEEINSEMCIRDRYNENTLKFDKYII